MSAVRLQSFWSWNIISKKETVDKWVSIYLMINRIQIPNKTTQCIPDTEYPLTVCNRCLVAKLDTPCDLA